VAARTVSARSSGVSPPCRPAHPARLQVRGAPPPPSSRRARGLPSGGAGPARRAGRVWRGRGLQRWERARHARRALGAHRRAWCGGKVTPRGVDGAELTALARHHLPAAPRARLAHQRHGATAVASRFEVVPPNGGDRWGSGPPLCAPPPQGPVARGPARPAPTRPSAGPRAVKVALAPGARLIARAPGGRRHRVATPPRFTVKRLATRRPATPRVIGRDSIIQPWRERDRVVAVRAVEVAPRGRPLRHRNQRHACPRGGQTPEF
jgi:hypothetical protein